MSKSRTGNNSVSKTLIIYINTLHVLLNKCNYSLVKYFKRTPKQPCAKLIFEFTCTLSPIEVQAHTSSHKHYFQNTRQLCSILTLCTVHSVVIHTHLLCKIHFQFENLYW